MKKNIIEKINKIKNDKFWKNLFKNSFYAFAGDTGSSVINFIITLLIIKLLGNNNYGILVLAQSYTTIIDLLLNLQCWKTVITYGEEALEKKDLESFFGYVKMGVILDVTTAIIGFVFCLLATDFIGYLFNWTSDTILCSKILATVIISHFAGTPTAILRIMDKFNLVAIQKFLASFIKLLIFIFLLLFNNSISLINITIIYAIADIFGNILLVIMASYQFNKNYGLKKLIKAKLPKKKKDFIKFTFWTTLSDSVDIPVQHLDVFIVSMLSIEMVAIFKVFKQLVSIISKVMTPIQQAILPQFSELVAKGNMKRAYAVYKKINKTILTIGLPCALLVGVLSPLWLKIIFGTLYAKYWYVLLIYLLSQVIAFSFSCLHPLFVSMGKVFYSFIYGLITNIAYLIIAVLLVKPLGMIGLIIAFTFQYGLLVFLKTENIKKELKI